MSTTCRADGNADCGAGSVASSEGWNEGTEAAVDADADVDAGAEAVDVADVVLAALVVDHNVDGVEVNEGRF